MNNILNSNLMSLLSGVDKNKIEQISNMVRNMSKDDLNNLVNLLGSNGNRSESSDIQNDGSSPSESTTK